MTKRVPPLPPNRPSNTTPPAHQSHAAAIRETIESIAIAFVLAFLFRTFEAEAFVIPTGSMAPTLMGRHKDLECPECHYQFQVSASEEVDRNGGVKANPPLIDRCTCPMCRYVWDGKEGPIASPSYNGDRILVNKFIYEFSDPRRWDVIVFKYPLKAQENYIKRLIGLPGETVRVHRGDIFTRGGDRDAFEIARKPPEKLRVMLQPVFDNDYMPAIEKLGWPARWQPEPSADEKPPPNGLRPTMPFSKPTAAPRAKPGSAIEHLVPSPRQWSEHERGVPSSADPVRPQLITDFTAYNTGSSEEDRGMRPLDFTGKHWVGDLALQCRADVENDRGRIVLELVKGGKRFQCRIDVGTGKAEFAIGGLDKKRFNPQFPTVLHGPGKYTLRFANCDRRLYLWINDRFVQYADCPPDLKNDVPQPSDLQPVGVASAGVKMKVEHLKIFRDIYYIATSLRDRQERMYDYLTLPLDIQDGNFEEFFSDPAQWGAFDDNNMASVEFPLQQDEFFAMGDNSAKSRDSRSWGTVPRDLLIGKAFFVYWPHSWDRIPGTRIPFPYFPNFARMRFVR